MESCGKTELLEEKFHDGQGQLISYSSSSLLLLPPSSSSSSPSSTTAPLGVGEDRSGLPAENSNTSKAKLPKEPTLSEMMAEIRRSFAAYKSQMSSLQDQYGALIAEKTQIEQSVSSLETSVKTHQEVRDLVSKDLREAEKELDEARLQAHLALQSIAKPDVQLVSSGNNVAKNIIGFNSSSANSGPSTNGDLTTMRSCPPILQPSVMQGLAEQLLRANFFFYDAALPIDVAENLIKMVRALQAQNRLVPGKMGGGRVGKDAPQVHDASKRGDLMGYFSHTAADCEALVPYFSFLDALVTGLIKFIPEFSDVVIERSQAMVAVYPGEGARYIRHADNPGGNLDNGRILTVLLYLNKQWQSQDGGQLKLYLTEEGEAREKLIDPIFNRLAVFYSDVRVIHEVLPAYSERMAVSIWYTDSMRRMKALEETKSC